MADKTTTDYSLQLKAEFADGDDRTISISNPTSAESIGAQIYALQTFLQTTNALIGDKAGAAFTQFRYANKVTKTKTILDLGI